MLMKKARAILLIILLVALTIMSVSCANPSQRVQDALKKAEAYQAVEIKGIGNAIVSLNSDDNKTNIGYTYDIKTKENDVIMDMDIKSDVVSMTMKVYMVGDKLLISMPLLTDKYIDASEMKSQMNMDGISKILSSFDFDVASTKLESEETTINIEGIDTKVLKVKVLLDNDKMKELIKKIYEQQNFSTDALSGTSQSDMATLYDSINLQSAEYTIYIDKDDNIKRYEVNADYSMAVNGEIATISMDMDYDIIRTDNAVEINLPDISSDNMVNMSDLVTQ
jgi:archaellum component FlaF (FlaF/FlaG flagellin family)